MIHDCVLLTLFQTALEVVSEVLGSLDNRLRKHTAQSVADCYLTSEAVHLGSW